MGVVWSDSVTATRLDLAVQAIDAHGNGWLGLYNDSYQNLLVSLPLNRPSFARTGFWQLVMQGVPLTATALANGRPVLGAFFDANGDVVASGLVVGTDALVCDLVLRDVDVVAGRSITISSGTITA